MQEGGHVISKRVSEYAIRYTTTHQKYYSLSIAIVFAAWPVLLSRTKFDVKFRTKCFTIVKTMTFSL